MSIIIHRLRLQLFIYRDAKLSLLPKGIDWECEITAYRGEYLVLREMTLEENL
jgi:hypothetical protein